RDAVQSAREVRRLARRQDLAGLCDRTHPCREVQCPTAVAALDADCLTRVDADADAVRRVRILERQCDEPALHLDSRTESLPRRGEDAECLVTAQLLDPATGIRRDL